MFCFTYLVNQNDHFYDLMYEMQSAALLLLLKISLYVHKLSNGSC